jgi:sugar phosphate isomerase/epimerase
VTRSEAELFGISDPRFAARVYLDAPRLYPEADANAYFINARRMLSFCANAPDWREQQPYASHCVGITPLYPQPRRPAWYLRNSSCVADCVLPPQAAPPGYHVLTAPLGRIYGEIDTGPAEEPVRKDVLGVPFLMHMRLSGGMCAQAVCFMATLLMHEHAKDVYGVADITALAGGGTVDELPLAGLDPPKMFRYFRDGQVGLNAEWQFPAYFGQKRDEIGQFPANLGQERDEIGGLRGALQAYLRSDMPVAFPVDSGRLAGLPNRKPPLRHAAIYKANAVQVGIRNADRVSRLNHVVLLVGCDDADRFLLNDTGAYPFLVATADQLYEARRYKDVACQQPGAPIFLPVTPPHVRLPLQVWYKNGKCEKLDEGRPGLLQIAEQVQAGWFPTHRPLRIEPPSDPGQMRLLPLSRFLAEMLLPRSRLLAEMAMPDAAKTVIGEWLKHLRDKEHQWCWVQCTDAVTPSNDTVPSVWLWDATRSPPDAGPDSDTAADYALAVFACGKGGWEKLWAHPRLATPEIPEVPPAVRESLPSDKPRTRPLKPALISSFATKDGLPGALHSWPDKEVACELYAFMRTDAERYLGKPWRLTWHEAKRYWSYGFWARLGDLSRLVSFKGNSDKKAHWVGLQRWRRRPGACWPTSTALDLMAALDDDHDALDGAAEALAREFKAHHIQIVAIATFLPEIVGPSHRRAKAAQATLRFLLHLVKRLKKHGHPISVMELVAGSVIHGVWAGWAERQSEAESRECPTIVANRFPPEKILRRLFEALQSLLADIKEAGVHVAVELEPGPLYALNNQDTLNLFCDIASKPEFKALSPYLALNVDVAHWALAGDIWSDLKGLDLDVPRRVIHAHVSDHGGGHLGDLQIGVVHLLEYFRERLQFVKQASAAKLAELPATPSGPPEKYAAVELEACADDDFVRESVKNLRTRL